MKSNIALSTSLSWNNNWDPYHSIEITKKFGIKNCQVFIGDNFDEDLSRNLAVNCNEEIYMLAHSPVDLNSEALKTDLNNKIAELLRGNRKVVVYHHDPAIEIKDTIEVIKKLNSLGIIVLLENFYSNISDVKETIFHYIELLKASNEEGCNIYPLIDIPRLFIKGMEKYIDPLKESIRIFKFINELKSPVYLHMIDCLSKSQRRDTWCCVGKGYIPYRIILDNITELGMDIPVAVLEYEDEKHIADSLEFLREFSIFK